jgi:hypothetical protein
MITLDPLNILNRMVFEAALQVGRIDNPSPVRRIVDPLC